MIDGRGLDHLLTAGALPWRLAVVVGAQVAAALAAAHTQGVVHRDVKPGKVMATAAGIKLVDFGISATAGEADSADGQVLGAPAYLAPERINGGPVRPATDVYALGLLLYKMLTGHMPWRTSTVTEMVAAHRYQDPADLPDIAELPPQVAEPCRRCLSKQPADRPSAGEAARTLGEAAGLAQLGVGRPQVEPGAVGQDDPGCCRSVGDRVTKMSV
jgi:serine/threonine-protein kinase